MPSEKLWDIFCKVIDNYGDIGVCWRLSADLAARGHRVRLWVDEPDALAWMAPGALAGRWPRVQVLGADAWKASAMPATLPPADVWIEGFGCDLPAALVRQHFQASLAGPAQHRAPVWINLEYLTAESFAERAHGLPSPLLAGPARGNTRFFFYPGFSEHTGGLLRESDLALRQAGFDRSRWLAGQQIAWSGERLISLFCYEPQALASLLKQLQQAPQATRLLVTHGRAATSVRRVLGDMGWGENLAIGAPLGSLQLHWLPPLTQVDYDHLLWSCDLNFVRGEDSLVRAIWADRPFVWQIYPQYDDAHHAKLQAFLDTVQAPSSWRKLHLNWNGIGDAVLSPLDLGAWGESASQTRTRLTAQSDLTTRLLELVASVQTRLRPVAEKR